MKLPWIFLACTLLPACTTAVPKPQPGMPLDPEYLPDDPDKALTKVWVEPPHPLP